MAQDQSTTDTVLWRSISIAVVVALALRFASLAFPDLRLWGLNYFTYMPLSLSVVSSSAILLLLIPAIRNRILVYLSSIKDSNAKSGYAVLCTIIALLVIVFPMDTFFLGDGGMLIGEMFKVMNVEGYTSDVILDFRSSPLSGLILYSAAKLLPFAYNILGISASLQPMDPYRVLSLVSLIILYLYLRRSRNGSERLALLIAFMGTAGVLLFFGYVESYSLIYIAVGIYILAAVKFISGKSGVAPVAAAYVFALVAHFYTLALLPSFIYLITLKYLPEKFQAPRYPIMLVSVGALLWTVFYFASGIAAADSRIVIPFLPLITDAGTHSYTLLTSEHLLDIFNIVFLLAPIPAIFLLINKGWKSSAVPAKAQSFFILLLGFFTIFVFFANIMYGLPRDWDLTAPLGIIIMLSAVYIIAESSRRKWAVAIYFTLLNLLFFVPWLAVNLNNDAAKDRSYELILQDEGMLYPYLSIAGYEALRKQYLHEKNHDMEQEILMRMVGLHDHPDMYNLLISNNYNHYLDNPRRLDAINTWMLHRIDSVAHLLKAGKKSWAWHTRYKLDSLVAGIGYYAYMNNRLASFSEEFLRISRQHEFEIGVNAVNGMNSYRRGDYAGTARYLSRVVERQFYTSKIVGMLGSAFTLSGDFVAAEITFNDGFIRFPNDPELRVVRAIGLIQANEQLEKARQYLLDASKLAPPPDMQQLIQSYLQQLQ